MILWTDCRAYLLAEGAALPPLTWCVIPSLPSSEMSARKKLILI